MHRLAESVAGIPCYDHYASMGLRPRNGPRFLTQAIFRHVYLGILILPAVLSAAITADLDPSECYRVREITLAKDEARLYLTDGYLIFAKDTGGKRIAAVFSADVEGGDAELLLLPPNRAERRSLALYTGSPNLNEHFTAAVMLFTDDSDRELMDQIRANAHNRKSEEMGALMADKWSATVRNICSSFETRLQLDLLSSRLSRRGLFVASIGGKQLGNFDLVFDRRVPEPLFVGQLASRGGQSFFDTWTSFISRSYRNVPYAPEFELHDYRIDSTLDAGLLLRCITRIRLKLSGDAERVLPFDISNRMQVTAAMVDGEPAEIVQRDSVRSNLMRNTGNELFLVVAKTPLASGTEHEIEFRHEGNVVRDAGNRVYFVGSRGSWYPARGSQFAHYDLTFHYPRDLDLVAAGRLLEDTTEGGQRTTRRKTDAPIRMAGFNLGVFEKSRITRGDFSVEVCANRRAEQALQPRPRDQILVPPQQALGWPRQRQIPRAETVVVPELPPNPVNRLQTLASEIAGALEFFAGRFGPPPLRSVEVSPIPGRFGQGFAGMIYLSTLSYLSTSDKAISSLPQAQQLFFLELLHAHEAAHQWWGNVVTSAGYHDDWLMEALANYSALLYLEKRKGAKAADSILEEYKRNLLVKFEDRTIESIGPVVQGARLENSQTPNAWTSIVYGKGTWIMHMLRRRMGDDRFSQMLAELRARYAFKSLTTAQFQALCAEFVPAKSPDAKLESFFDQWVYGTGIPILKVSYAVKGKAPAWRVTGTVTQSGVDDDFSVNVPLEVQTGRWRPATLWVRTASEPVSFSAAVRSPSAKVALDPYSSVLHR